MVLPSATGSSRCLGRGSTWKGKGRWQVARFGQHECKPAHSRGEKEGDEQQGNWENGTVFVFVAMRNRSTLHNRGARQGKSVCGPCVCVLCCSFCFLFLSTPSQQHTMMAFTFLPLSTPFLMMGFCLSPLGKRWGGCGRSGWKLSHFYVAMW